ncbi:MAG TPA: histidinol dehydrogenase [Candidatus Stercoripulliclostridium merdigallinarum]|uniref:Histidinol dehydrogenase n=1 Tax=Candidatus Stercoripulliclostridium merdigallinarum TaxID=2840951 RepID=A0A9D1MHX6_9FIRM|nr:histidinol dehydrogenase [Candidatus Stercoripulliclostridium merdigallinarum]
MKIIKATDITPEQIVSQRDVAYVSVEESVKKVLNDVSERGDAALREYELRFDGVQIDDFAVTAEEIDAAVAAVGAEYIGILKRAAANIERFHRAQIRSDFSMNYDGITVGERFIPVQSAGLYVPGGTARYPSSVLMNCVPAKLAGVQNIIICTPPSKDGRIPDGILAAAKVAGADKVYKVGGAQAIAAMAYGTESIPKVDKIVGPGNVYVATAKKLVQGICGIDMIAGPSEILVIADETANADWLAADLLSQAEHDKLASAIMITDSEALATAVSAAVEKRLEKLPRREIAAESIKNNGKIIITESIMQAAELSDRIAPEHLELAVARPEKLLEQIKNAGSVFLGHYTPEATGDYMAGTNHTLPTGGTARFSSPLGVDDFIKKTQFIKMSREALENYYRDIAAFAESEGLNAHAESVKARFESND